ncbi:MAG: gluconokinase, GntK/IdnK-type [Actinomycetota bacterium]|nr:gluconokinase, GntK/IdnK-type [Actinomycetota bacterium]
MSGARRVVVMGVAGSGKSLVGSALALALGVPFLEGDDLHPADNVAAMRAGTPLTDRERWPWLAAIRQALRDRPAAVVSCSALRRSYRDALRAAGDVCFLYLYVDPLEAARRVGGRSAHFMGVAMLESQFAALERPDPDETDVACLDAGRAPGELVQLARTALARLTPGTAVAPLRQWGGASADLRTDDLEQLVASLVAEQIVPRPAQRILLVPPDHTRLGSRGGELTGLLLHALEDAGAEVAVLPATGTHRPMSEQDCAQLFGERVPPGRLRHHDWRHGVVQVGEIGAAEVSAVSGGRLEVPVPVAVDAQLLEGWDLVVSIGQVLPHEVVGMANYTKNLVVGLGGAATIDQTHLLGALCGMETIMGRASTPVRDVVDAAFDRFVAPLVEVLFVVTVVEQRGDRTVLRAVLAGRGGSGGTGGAAYRQAAQLAGVCNVQIVPEPLARVSCYLDPAEFHSTWLGNKAVYRTRMALADGAHLLVLAPGVDRFGEDAQIDALIRRHGYRGTPAVVGALGRDSELAGNASAAAHLVHGSTEGRFSVTYCTDPDRGGLTRAELEAVGYGWRPLAQALDELGVGAGSPTGPRLDAGGSPFFHIANPALGLWSTAARFGGAQA